MMRCLAVRSVAGLGGLMLALALLTATTAAAELFMFEESGCPWCRRWHAEVGIAYPKTPEGQRAPLRRLELHAARPAGVTFAKPVTVSPTFVLVEDGREVDRITGYPGADFFWGLLGEMLGKLKTTSGRAPHDVVLAATDRTDQRLRAPPGIAQPTMQP